LADQTFCPMRKDIRPMFIVEMPRLEYLADELAAAIRAKTQFKKFQFNQLRMPNVQWVVDSLG